MAVSDFKELIAWQRAMDLAERVYVITRMFPSDERFGLTSQLRRAAVSVASNIAEGQGRGAGRDFLHFLRMANGSRQEVETQLELAYRLDYLPLETLQSINAQLQELGRIISGLAASVR